MNGVTSNGVTRHLVHVTPFDVTPFHVTPALSRPQVSRTISLVGGGAIGLAIAWRLLERGAHVTVYDRGMPERAASWASAGLLAATAGHGGPAGSPLDALCRRSLDRWPAFAHALRDASGIDVGLRDAGTLAVALDEAEAMRLREAFDAWRDAGDDAQQWLDRAAVAAREPALADTVVAARWCPRDTQVDARELVTALRVAVQRAGGAIVTRDVASHDWIDGDVVIVAAGAWSATIDNGLAVSPLVGQMIAYEGAPPLGDVIFTPGAYLVPRGDRLLVGATSEARGFDATVTESGVRSLRAAAERAVPALARATVVDAWAGVRPMSPDGAPLLGWTSERMLVATGHSRNGILLAPITADAIAELALGGGAPEWLSSFAPQRFGDASGPSA